MPDLAGRRTERPEAGMPVGVRGLALTPEGRRLVTSSKAGGANGRLVVWDARTGARHRTIRGIGGGSLTVTADGRRVAAGDGSNADLSTGRVGRMPLDPDSHGGPTGDGGQADPGAGGDVSQFALSRDGRYVAVGDGSGRVTLLDGTLTRWRGALSGLFTSHQQDAAAPVTALAFSADGAVLAVGGLDGTVRLWDVSSNQALGTTLPAPADQVLSLVFRGDGRGDSLYVANQDVPSHAYALAPASVAAAVCARAGGGPSRAAWADFLAGVPYRRVCA
ncbi:WD40 repeat domain-containing protein [Streptomyces olivaceoviridis]|uniref:WD40 repeat domain-containing protein n=1 Tax=Streptomyces olivaceoviridis TaxID=1921 RepID=UPI0036C2523E